MNNEWNMNLLPYLCEAMENPRNWTDSA